LNFPLLYLSPAILPPGQPLIPGKPFAPGQPPTPQANEICCVRENLAVESDFGPDQDKDREMKIWNDRGSKADMNVSIWAIARPNMRGYGSDYIPVLADLFQGHNNHHEPPAPGLNLAKVLALPCPKTFIDFTAPPLSFTKETIPSEGDTFNELAQCEVVLPFTVFFAPTHRESLGHISEPFCTLSKRIAWYVEHKFYNNTAGPILDEVTITKGIPETESQETTHSAGVSVTTSYGIEAFGMEVSLNYQFTLSRSSSWTEYAEPLTSGRSLYPRITHLLS
jgi:hypothetical protein